MAEQYAPRDLRKELTDSIVEALETGKAPWQKPWDPEKAAACSNPHNAVTGRPYHGGNTLYLMFRAHQRDFSDPRWCTYKQAQEQGWQVNKGEKGSLVEYWEFSRRVPKEGPDGKPVVGPDGKKVYEEVPHPQPRVFHVTVFNVQQMTGVPPYEKPQQKWSANDQAESILVGSGATIHHGGDSAFYNPRRDEIQMPPKSAFESEAGYYSTALHELGHWTGHESRLARDGIVKFDHVGSPQYAKEELRAELASYFTSARLGLPHNPGNHAAYVQSWIAALKNDKHEIFRAAKDAEGISNYMIELARGRDQAVEHTDMPKAPEVQAIAVKEINYWYNHGDSTYGYSAKGVDGETVRRGNYLSESELAAAIGKGNAESVGYGIGQSDRQPDENRTFGKLKGSDLDPAIPAEIKPVEAQPVVDHEYQVSVDSGWAEATREQAAARDNGR